MMSEGPLTDRTSASDGDGGNPTTEEKSSTQPIEISVGGEEEGDEDAPLIRRKSHDIPNPSRLSCFIKLAFSLPSVAWALTIVPLAVHLNKFYTDVALLKASTLSIAICVARMLDFIIDPFVGYLSDITKTQWGRRKPYIAVGAPVVAVAFWLLFSPPESLDNFELSVWFCIFFTLNLAAPLHLPHDSMGPALTRSAEDRSSLYAYVQCFTMTGIFLGAVLPVLLGQLISDPRQLYSAMAGIASVLILLTFALLLVAVPDPDTSDHMYGMVAGVRRAVRNGPFCILLLVFVCNSISGHSISALLPYYIQYVLQPDNPSLWLAVTLMVYFGFSFITTPIWLYLATKYEKRTVWLLGHVLGVPFVLCFFFLQPGDLYLLLVMMSLGGVLHGAAFITWHIKADIIDYDELHTGMRREGQYVTFWAIVPKLVSIPTGAIPFAILGTLGYKPNIQQTDEVIFSIRAMMCLIPAICNCISFAAMIMYPITQRVLERIHQGVALHKQGRPALDPIKKKLLPPLKGRICSEQDAWLLDNLSLSELLVFEGNGGSFDGLLCSVVSEAIIWLILAVAIFVLALWMVFEWLYEGVWLVLVFFVLSILLAGGIWHLMRICPALQLQKNPPTRYSIRDHIDWLESEERPGEPQDALSDAATE
eukprot:gnl/Hemi2/16295_TR5418_c0_g1_i1.p1 gnl/Hemi2/16295_TR5418_c0_g1~~gnl/Hemi2/16295_TR5418_c0_g1_i1.p1  ORF type:complete len:681 (-),score=196.33 gnl/Hemi2/16295_TR5418_c0_g1_i1:157-2103(-)